MVVVASNGSLGSAGSSVLSRLDIQVQNFVHVGLVICQLLLKADVLPSQALAGPDLVSLDELGLITNKCFPCKCYSKN